MIETALIVTTVLLLDRWLGQFRRHQTLVGFGLLGARVERILFRGTDRSTRMCGVVGWIAMVLPVFVVALLLMHLQGFLFLLAQVFTLYLVLNSRTLSVQAFGVQQALLQKNLALARERLGWIVQQDCEQLDEEQIASVTIESLLERANESLFAPIFWFVVAGIPGVLLFRAVSILSSMWSYKNDRYYQFGWFSGRAHHWLCWIPVRLMALNYLLLGKSSAVVNGWRYQANLCSSQNRGVMMATGANALQIKLGGVAWHHDKLIAHPILGCCRRPFPNDIERIMVLIEHGLLVWIALLWLVGFYYG